MMKIMKIAIVLSILGVTVYSSIAQRGIKVKERYRNADGGDKWAVIIGVNNYEDKQINDLQFAVADADAVHALLTDSEIGGFEKNKVKLITDTSEIKPTRDNILLALKFIESGADEKDTVFIFFSGHGIEEDGVSYFIPSTANIDLLSDTAISMERFMKPLKKSKAKAQVLFFDACHSGVRLDNKAVSGKMSKDAFDYIFSEAEGRVILSSCKNNEITWEYPEKGHGVFTYFLLDALKGNADVDGNGIVSVSETSNYVTGKVKEWSFDNDKLQTPRVSSNISGDIALTILPADITKPEIYIEEPESLRFSTTQVFFIDNRPIRLTGIAADNIGVASVKINERDISLIPLVDEELERWRTKLSRLLNDERQSPRQLVRFELPLNLAEGQTNIRIVASDDVGNKSLLNRTFNVQQRPNVLSTTAELIVSSHPSGATVYVDGKVYGKTPLTENINLGVDTQRKVEVGLELAGYKSQVASLTLKRRQKTYWEDVQLNQLPNLKQATLVVSSYPSGAMVFVDGKECGKTPLTKKIDLGLQEQRLIEAGLKLDGYKTKLATLTLRHGQVSNWKNQQLEKLSSVPEMISTIATVTISSSPSGATVYIDGRDYGKTPLTTEVDMGVFRNKQAKVKLVLSGYNNYEDYLNLERGQKVNLTNITLKQLRLDDEMVLIPAGKFRMGSKKGGKKERVHEVYLDAFYIDKYEVTNAQYRAFVQATGRPEPKGLLLSSQGIDMNFRPLAHSEWNAPNQPVVCVSWEDAMAYAKWVGKSLPTEAQWEKAVRGGLDQKEYPWGDTFKVGLVTANNRSEKVGSYPPNGYGIYDMMGNVWEWCLDWYDGNYYKSSPQKNPVNTTIPKRMRFRVIRGGSWRDNAPSFFRCAVRGRLAPTTKDTATGFRCVKLAN